MLLQSVQPSFGLESYIAAVDIHKYRRCLATFRFSAHNLMIETGRYKNISRENRFCWYCECIVEDELHFLLVCPLYKDIRSKYIKESNANIPPKKFLSIMSSKNETKLRNLAMYLFHSFKTRNEYIKMIDS